MHIKGHALDNAINNKDRSSASIKKLIIREVKADRLCRTSIHKFLAWGKLVNPGNKDYTFVSESPDIYARYSVDQLINKVEKEAKEAERISIEKAKTHYELSKDYEKNLTQLIENRLENINLNIEKAKSNNEYSDPRLGVIAARRTYPIEGSLWNKDDSISAYIYISKGVIEGYKVVNQGLGTINTEFNLRLNESRKEMVKSIAEKYSNLGPGVENLKSIYAISIDRLTFEFLEIRPNSNKYGYLTGSSSDVCVENNCEIYSIIDIKNESCKFKLNSWGGEEIVAIPKHDYHFWGHEDEHSIRKFMDFVYKNDNGELCYQSNISNESFPKGLDKGKTVETYSDDSEPIKMKDLRYNIKPDQTANFGLSKSKVVRYWEEGTDQMGKTQASVWLSKNRLAQEELSNVPQYSSISFTNPTKSIYTTAAVKGKIPDKIEFIDLTAEVIEAERFKEEVQYEIVGLENISDSGDLVQMQIEANVQNTNRAETTFEERIARVQNVEPALVEDDIYGSDDDLNIPSYSPNEDLNMPSYSPQSDNSPEDLAMPVKSPLNEEISQYENFPVSFSPQNVEEYGQMDLLLKSGQDLNVIVPSIENDNNTEENVIIPSIENDNKIVVPSPQNGNEADEDIVMYSSPQNVGPAPTTFEEVFEELEEVNEQNVDFIFSQQNVEPSVLENIMYDSDNIYDSDNNRPIKKIKRK